MRWPEHPVEGVRPSRFRPPFCPWPACRAHLGPGLGFQRFGSYLRPGDRVRVPRFRCRDCRRTCSRQTFSTTYYLKRPSLLATVAAGLAACSAHRQIARSAGCSKTSVTRMAERLGRHAILLHARCRSRLDTLSEAIVHDHFETFVGRQDEALGIGTAVGATSWFVYDVDPAPHRGSGRRPDRNPGRAKSAVCVSRPYVTSIRRTFAGLVENRDGNERIVVRVDGRADYRAALRDPAIGCAVALRVYPNPARGPKDAPRSDETRVRDHAMFPVDQWHQMLRHSCADHKRETISFGRRLESIVGRAYLMAVWKNFVKARSERAPDRTTPAMRLGLADRPWRWRRVLSRRLFPGRERPTEASMRVYRKRWTPTLPAFERAHAG